MTMAANTKIFADEETNNWFKACIALTVTKTGLTNFIENTIKKVHAPFGSSCGQCSIEFPKCQTCVKVKLGIESCHRFKRPSWKNTKAQGWKSNWWQIAKCYLPPTGYAGVSSVQESDFNAVINIILNCKDFQNHLCSSWLLPLPPNPQCPLEKVRQIGRDVRHSATCKTTVAELQYYFKTLTNLLADSKCLARDPDANKAVIMLTDLQNDRLPLTEFGNLIQDFKQAIERIKDATEQEFSEKLKQTLEEGLNKIKEALKDVEQVIQQANSEITAKMTDATSQIEHKKGESVQILYDRAEYCKQKIVAETETLIKSSVQLIKDESKDSVEVIQRKMTEATSQIEEKKGESVQTLYDRAEYCKQKIVAEMETLTKSSVQLIKDLTNDSIECIQQTDNDKAKDDYKDNAEEERSKSNIQARNQNEKEEYERGVAEMLKILKTHYKRKLSNLTFSPLNDSVAAPLDDFYMQPNIQFMKKDKGCFIKTGTQILLYKNLFSKDSKLNQQTFIQGEAGSGKSTFLARLVMDWCDSPKRSDNFFQDLKTLKDYKFIFLVTLRNSVQEFKIEEIIKQQVIDSLYGKEDCEKAYKLLNEIMKQEHCLILLDGLDEWTGPGNDHNLPELKALHYTESRCDLLITTRPWKLADGKIKDSEIDILLQLEGIKYPFKLSKCILRRKYQDENVLKAKNSAFTKYIQKQKLKELLQSPMMLSVIVCWHDEGERKLISKCEIYSSLIDSLLKKVSNEEGYFEDQRFNCFAETQYIQPNIHHVNQIAEAAFRLLFSDIQEKSLVFGAKDLKLEDAQRKFALKAGILTKAKTSSLARSSSTFSFFHKSIQEFLAAYYIACNEKVINETIAGYFEQYDKSYLAMTQLFIFLCGVSISAGNALSDLMNKSNVKYNSHGNTLYQDCVFAGYREAVANNRQSTGSINLRLTCFIINDISLDLQNLWNMNVSNVMSLTMRLPSVHRVYTGFKIDLSLCHKLKSLQLEGPGIELKDSASVTSLEFWIVQISTDPSQCTTLPSIEYISLYNVKCSYTLLCSLLSILLTLDHQVKFSLTRCEITSCVKGAVSTLFNTGDVKIKTENKKIAVSSFGKKLFNDLNGLNINSLSLDDRCKAFRENHKESLSQTLVLLSQLDKLRVSVHDDTPDKWKTLHGLNIKSLSLFLVEVKHAESLSQSLASLKQLEMLSFVVPNGNPALFEALLGLGIKSLSISVDEDSPGLWEALQGLSIKSLSLNLSPIFFENPNYRLKYATSLKQSILSLKELETLSIRVDYDSPGLWEALHSLSIKSLSLSLSQDLNKGNPGFRLKYAMSLKQSILSLKELETLSISVDYDSPGLWESLHSLSIKSLSLNLKKNHGDGIPGFRLKYAMSLKQTILSLKELETLSISVDYISPGLWESLHSLSIKSLILIDRGFETKCAESLKRLLSSLTKLDTLSIREDKTNPDLWEALHGLSIKSLSMSLGSKYIFYTDFNLKYAESIRKSLLSLTQLDTLSIIAKRECPGLCETLNGLNIKRLSLSGEKRGLRVDHAESLSQSLLSLSQLETLTLHLNTYIALQVPRSLKYLNIYSKKLLPSELRDLVSRLAARPHAIDIELEIGCASSIDPPEQILLQEYILVQQELVSRPNVFVKKFRTYESESNSTMPVHYPAHCDLSIKDYAYDIFAELMERFKYSRISIGLQINPDSFL